MTAGVDPAGNKLSVAMPTYRMPLQDMSDLIAYLKRIETDLDPGVSETSIVIGTLLPDKTALTGLAQLMEDVLRAYGYDRSGEKTVSGQRGMDLGD